MLPGREAKLRWFHIVVTYTIRFVKSIRREEKIQYMLMYSCHSMYIASVDIPHASLDYWSLDYWLWARSVRPSHVSNNQRRTLVDRGS